MRRLYIYYTARDVLCISGPYISPESIFQCYGFIIIQIRQRKNYERIMRSAPCFAMFSDYIPKYSYFTYLPYKCKQQDGKEAVYFQ